MADVKLTADLDSVSNSNIEIQLLGADLNIIQKLDDEPNDVGGLTSAQLKETFDKSGNIIKQYINETLIPKIIAEDATEDARKAAEAAREANESQRIENENARIEAEHGRATAEIARSDAEQERTTAESVRNTAEQARESAEQARADETSGIVAQATAQAVIATNAAHEARNSASSAATSASAASDSASSASASATAAAQSKTSAIEAKTAAETAKTEAGKSASAAKESETASKTSETAAAKSATAAQSAQIGAEAARDASAQSAKNAADVAATLGALPADVTQLKDELEHLIDYNIIDNSIAIDNKVIGADTSVFADNLFAISNPFNVKKGQKVVVKARGHANGTIIAMIDGNGYYPLVVTDETVYKEYSYVATKNMKLVICFRKSNSFYGFYGVPINDELAKVSGTPEAFATQKEFFDQWEKTHFSIGKNRFDKSSLINGYAIDALNGELFESVDYRVSTFISVKENTAYYRNLESTVVFYDAMFKYISGIGFGIGTFITPTNTAYIRTSLYWGYLKNFQIEEGEIGTSYEAYQSYDDKAEQLYRRSQIRKPFPVKITPTMGVVGGNEISVEDKDKDGNLYATRWDNKIWKLPKGNDPYTFASDGWTLVINVAPFLDNGETISQYNMRITDTGRICVATNKGRVLVSNEEQTAFNHAFTFTNGYSQNTWGCDKYDKYVLFASYGVPVTGNTEPPHEVYLSSDFGATWNKIFDKPIEEMSVPNKFHIHDVAIDPFSEAIIVVTGDYENDRRIYYSYDLGVTWTPTNPNGEYCKIHPTSIVCMPKGIAFGSDDFPKEGIYWWERPYGVDKPEIKEDDIVCVNLFNTVTDKILTNCGVKGDYLITNYGVFGVIGFLQQNNSHTARLFVTGDGGVSWHEVYIEQGDTLNGFFGARLIEENGKVKIYANYGSEDGSYKLFVADMPVFYNE